MGDEVTESYFLCEHCGVYTVEVIHEPFLGKESISYRGPVARTKGEAAVDLMRRCPDPWDKKCRCEAHTSYFEGWLD